MGETSFVGSDLRYNASSAHPHRTPRLPLLPALYIPNPDPELVNTLCKQTYRCSRHSLHLRVRSRRCGLNEAGCWSAEGDDAGEEFKFFPAWLLGRRATCDGARRSVEDWFESVFEFRDVV
jgi:hypothetical protein